MITTERLQEIKGKWAPPEVVAELVTALDETQAELAEKDTLAHHRYKIATKERDRAVKERNNLHYERTALRKQLAASQAEVERWKEFSANLSETYKYDPR